MTTPTTGVWTYPETAGIQGDLTGYKVEAIDGDIGKIDKASNEVGSACIVVDTGPWIFGKKVMIPAGIVRSVDPDSETVFVDRTKDAIKDSPEYDEDKYNDPAYRDELGSYYSSSGS
jgi:hypothetical protein